MAVRGHLNHHAVTVGDGAHGELATRTRVEPLDVRAGASCDDDFGAGQPCREDLAFAVSQLKALVGELGLDVDAAEAAWQDDRWKQRLRAVNEAAVAAGVFGAPFFLIDGEPFWGNDRQPQIERWLASGPFTRL